MRLGIRDTFLLSRRGLGLAAAIVTVVLAVNALVFYRNTQILLAHENAVTHSQLVLGSLDRTLVAMTDAETGQRGYILTGHQSYLAPYTDAVRQIGPDLDRIGRLIAGNPVQQQRLSRLRGLVDAKQAELKQTIDLERAGRSGEAREIVLSDRGRVLMDQIRAQIQSMTATELGVLAQRMAAARHAANVTTLTLAVATFGDVALLAGLLTVLWRALARRAARAAAQAHLLASEQKARAAAEEAVRMRDAFLSLAAHELKTPLTPLLGYADLLQRRLLLHPETTERERRHVTGIVDSARRLHRLIERLLDVSRMQGGQLTLHHAPLDLAPVVRRAVANAQLGTDRHTLDIHGGDDALPVIGDVLRLEQALDNVLANAIKYSPRGGRVCVEIARDGAYDGTQAPQVRISISDEGIGIPDAAQAHLFKQFYRAPNADTAAATGMGIGLYVVWEIVTGHAGTVDVESAEGVGTTVTLTLPLAPAADTTALTDAAALAERR